MPPGKDFGRSWEEVANTADPLLATRCRTAKPGGQVDALWYTQECC